MDGQGSRSRARALQVLADHSGWYGAPQVTLVFDLSGHHDHRSVAPFLYACDEEATTAHLLKKHIQEGAARFPPGGVFYRDHSRMIRRLADDKAQVHTLVVVLPDDNDSSEYYSPPSLLPAHGLLPIHRLKRFSEPMRDVMAFASTTAERVVLFNAGAALHLSHRFSDELPKPLAHALLSPPGIRFSACRELVLTRGYRLDARRGDRLHEQGKESPPDAYVQPLWGISSKTFPALRTMHTIADYVGVSPVDILDFRDQVLESDTGVRRRPHDYGMGSRYDYLLEEEEDQDQYSRILEESERRPRPDLSLPDIPRPDGLPGIPASRVFYGLDCKVGPESDPYTYGAAYWEMLGISRPGIFSLPPSRDLPALYTHTHDLLKRMRRAMPP